MASRQRPRNVSSADGETAAEETAKAPSVEERKDMRAHDGNGNVRPADGRWPLHVPKDESKHVRTDKAEENR